jgi:hypothetical protein
MPLNNDDSQTVAANNNDYLTAMATPPPAAPQMGGIPAAAAAPPQVILEKAPAAPTKAAGDDSPTIGYYEAAIGTEPVVGWMVCIEGNHRGEDFRLKAGRNFVGRSSSMDISLTGDSSVARDRHAVVVYEPKSVSYLVQSGESKELCYLNDKVVLAVEEMKPYDVLTVGNTKLKFFPCCSEDFHWGQGDEVGQ